MKKTTRNGLAVKITDLDTCFGVIRVGILLLMATLASTACATVFISFPAEFELSRAERHTLEHAACSPFNVKMQKSFGFDFHNDKQKDAIARCAKHATIYGHPVFFKRSCSYDRKWTYDAEIETLLVMFPDRRISITAEGVSLTEAYCIVSYFVLHRLFERANVTDIVGGTKKPPLDSCRVKALEGNELEFKCQLAERRVERSRSGGAIHFRQMPLPWCATKDNDACLNGP